jgi:hypothetical protein
MDALLWIPGLFMPIAIVYLFFKRRRQGARAVDLPDEPVLGTAAEREAEEKELRAAPIDYRERLIETMEVRARFPTRLGYSEASLVPLLNKLRESGIACELYFQSTGLMGVADAVISDHGLLELYVERGKGEAADRIVAEWEKA